MLPNIFILYCRGLLKNDVSLELRPIVISIQRISLFFFPNSEKLKIQEMPINCSRQQIYYKTERKSTYTKSVAKINKFKKKEYLVTFYFHNLSPKSAIQDQFRSIVLRRNTFTSSSRGRILRHLELEYPLILVTH